MNAAATNRRKTLMLGTAIAGTLLAPGFTAMPAKADPSPNATPVVSSNGGATITTPSPSSTDVSVNLNNASRVINWTSFDVGKNSSVNFNSASTTAQLGVLNRVTGSAAGGSEIDGPITSQSNIHVWLIDPNGITFNNEGSFNGASLMVSTLGVTDADFLDNYDGVAGGDSVNLTTAGSGAVTLEAGSSLTSSGNLILAAPLVSVSGEIDATGEVALVAAKNITFNAGLGSPLSFTITTGTPLAGVTVTGTGDIAGGSVALVGVSDVTAVGSLLSVAAGGKLTATANGGSVILATADTGTIAVPENGDGIVHNGSILSGPGAANVSAQIVSAAGVSGAGTVNVSGAGTISGTSVNLTGNLTTGAGLDVDATTGNATLSGTVQTGGTTTVDAGGTVNVKNLTASAGNVTLTGTAITLVAATLIAQAGTLALAGPVTMTDSTSTLQGTGITLGTVDGDTAGHGDLVLNSTGVAALNGAVGGTNSIKSLTTNAGGSTQINGGTVRTANAQTYNDAVVLGANTTLTSTGKQNIGFASTVDGAFTLNVNTGGVTSFSGNVGATTPLTSIFTDNAGVVGEKTQLGAVIKTTGLQTYNDPIELTADAKLWSTGGGTLTTQTVNGAHNLSLETTGAVSLGQLGGLVALSGLAVRANTLSLPGAAQSVDSLAMNITGSGITFLDDRTLTIATIDGLSGVTAATGNIVLTAQGALSNLQVDAPVVATAGSVQLNAGLTATVASNVTAGGGSYAVNAVAVTLGGASTVTQQAATNIAISASGGDITGLAGLTLKSNTSGTATFNVGALDLYAPLGSIALDVNSIQQAPGAYLGLNTSALGSISLGDVTAKAILKVNTPTLSYNLPPLTVGGNFTAGNIVIEDGLSANVSGNFRAKSVSVTGPVFVTGSLINLQVGGDVTGVALGAPNAANSDPGFGRLDLSVPAGTVTVTSGGLVQLGAIQANGDVSVTAGATTNTGSIDITSVNTPSGNLNLNALSLGGDAAHDGDILLGRADAGLSVTLDNNSTGLSGDIQVSDKIVSAGPITLDSENDVRLAQYDAGANTGYLKSNGGSISISAEGSVHGIGRSATALGTTARGIGSLAFSGDGTVTAAGDARFGSVTAGGNLTLDVAGSLTGVAGGTLATVAGGSLFATAGSVTVTTPTTANHIISLDTVQADTITLTSNVIGVNTLINEVGSPTLNGAFYVNNYTLGAGVTTFTAGDPEADGITAIAVVTTDTAGTDRLDLAYGSVDLSATGSITSPAAGSIGRVAQLGTVTAGGLINLDAQAIAAGQVTSTGSSITLLASAGTLSVTGADAATTLTLTKQGGSAATAGDDLRVDTAQAGNPAAGTALLDSATHLRIGSLNAQGQANLVARTGNLTGLLGASSGTSDTAYGRALVATTGGASVFIDADGLVQLGASSAAGTFQVLAGNYASSGQDGAIDATTITAGNALNLGATAFSPASPTGRDGDISIISGSAGGQAFLTNRFTGNIGDIVIGDRIVAAGNVFLHSADDIQLAQYDTAGNGGTGSGLVRTTGGNIDVLANGSVFTVSESALGVTARGIGSVAGGNLTVAASGDARIDTIAATGNLALAIGGSLTGAGAGTTAAVGAALFAEGAAGTISVNAGLGTDPSVAVFDTVKAGSNIAIAADQIAVNTIESTSGTVSLSGAHYVGSISVGGTTLSLGDADDDGVVTAIALATTDTVGIDKFAAAFGSTAITAGGTVITTSAIGQAAQLGNVTAGGLVDLDAKAIAAGQATSSAGAIDLLATQGTLSLTGADAATNLTLTKQGGSAATAGDELRVGTALAGNPAAGAAVLDSSTHVRADAVDAQGNLILTARTGDVTGTLGASSGTSDTAYGRANLAALTGTSDLTVTADGLAQLGTVSAARDLTVTAGNYAGSARDGAIDIVAATAGQNLILGATATAPAADAAHDGDILLGTGAAGNFAVISNSGGTIGDVAIRDRLLTGSFIQIFSADDIRLAQYDAAGNAGTGSGLLRATAGEILLSAKGSVYTTQENALEATRRTIDVITGNNVTIASSGDVRLDSITVTGNLAFDIAGSLTGRGGGVGGTTTVNGAALFAQGAGGNVTVNAGVGATPGNDVISLDRIVASGNVTLAADEIAVRDIQAGGNVNLTGAYYIGTVAIGGGTLTLGDGDNNGIDAIALFIDDAAANPLAAGFGKTSITAGGSVTSPSATSIGGVAQLGTVTAGGAVNLDAKAVTGDTVTSTGAAVTLLATAGTLAVGTADAATDLTLTKQGGALGNAGDELRVTTALAGAPAAGNGVLTSSTNARVGTVDAQGAVTVTAQSGDVTGLKGVSSGTTDTAYGRAQLTATGAAADVAITAAGLAQLGPVTAGRTITVTAGDATHNGAIDISNATATAGNLLLTARGTSPAADAIRDGDIVLGTGVAGALARLSNVISGGSIGRIDVATSLTAQNDAIVDAAADARLASITATAGSAIARARGAVGGVTAGTGVILSGGEDVAVKAGTNAVIASAVAGDDIVMTAGGALTVSGTLTTTGSGPNTRSVIFTDPAVISFGAETLPGADIVLTGAGVTLGGLTKSAGAVAIVGGPSATTAGIDAAGAVSVGAGTVSVGAVGAGGAVALTSTSGPLAAASVTAGGAATLTGGTTVTVAGATTSASDISVTAPGAVSLAAVNGRNVSLTGGTLTTGAVAATVGLTAKSTAGALTLASATAGGNATVSSATTATVAGALDATGDVTVSAAGAGSLATVKGRNVSLTGDTLGSGAIAATAAVTAKTTGGAMTLASVSAGGNASLTSASTATVNGALTATGDVTVTAPGAVSLAAVNGRNVSLSGGPLGTGAITATADLVAKSTSGALSLASASVGGNAVLTGATTATVAGALTVAGDLTVTAPGAVTLSTVRGRTVTLTGGTLDTGAITATADLVAKSTTGALTLASITAAGNATVTGATTATVAGALAATGDVNVSAPGAVTLAAVNGRNVTLSGSTVNAGATTATGNLSATSTSGALTLASASAGGNATLTGATTATVTGALGASGDIAVTAPGAVTLGTVGGRNVSLTGGTLAAGATTATGTLTARSTSGALTLASANATGAASITAATTATVAGALTSQGDVTVTAPGAVAIGSLGGRAVSITGSTVSAGATTTTGSLAVTSTAGTLALGNTTAGGPVTLTAATRATLGSIAAGSQSVTLTASDADINGTVSGGTVRVVDRAAGDNPLVIGDGTGVTTGFILSQEEVNRLNAATVVLDPGTALANSQNVRIGALAVDADTGATTLSLLGTKRIDITGVVGASGSRAIVLGGNGTAATDLSNAATVLRVAAQGSGGGRLIMPGVNLTLRANSLGVGQDAAFLDALGLNVGGTPLGSAQVATDYVGNTFSTLYTSLRGGTPYTDPTLVSAGSLTVRYSNFALFQNTGLVAANSGVVLQSTGATALDIRGLGTTQGGPFAIFGSINGITNQAAAVLGEPIVTFTTAPSIDRSASRINGCLIGSGSACIGLNINPAQLPALDPIRDQLIDRPEGLEIPFDPLVGTNNESLFGDVGTFGLSDVPLDLVECKKDEDGKCETPAEGGN